MRVTRNSTISSVSDPALETRPAIPAAPPARPDPGAVAGLPVRPVDIEARGLGRQFGETPVFSDIGFRLARGESVALVGANGAGKSTLLRCLMGLIPVSSGRVSLLGTDPNTARGPDLRRLRARVGLVSQKHNLVPRLSVLSNVLHGLLGKAPGPRHWSHALAPRASRAAAMAALDRVGLADFALRRADRLSGGQSQRVAIARAIVGDPEVLFADEPCASLDPAAGEDVMDLFFRLVRDKGVTVVFTSHNVDHALRYGDRVLGLAGGRLQLDATAASLSAATLRGLYD
ncbi:MAG: phosphonate transport system ATP-binding protein [Rhodobacteraceae bacterium HLUCCA08]|nr:MAG: phosphonate transport system ATP-binding protein [Rhodobacteraceae bacterium HLUCCA08]